MTKRNAENERVKRRYLLFLKDAKGATPPLSTPPRAQSSASRSTQSGVTSEPSISNRLADSRPI